jgi:hypothetical protein
MFTDDNSNITTEHHHAVTHYFKDFNISLADYFITLLHFITKIIEHLLCITIICIEDVQ